jgi:hypothetical protein
MSRIFVSEATGAAIYVFADDHCPPHIHARHRSEGWVARVRFSYIDSAVELSSIAPLKNVPLQRVVNALLDDIRARLVPAGLVDHEADNLPRKPMGRRAVR